MIWQSASSRRKQIVIDISTQRDFFLAEGKACIRNHRRVLANIRRIMAWARHKNLSVISTCQIYPGNNGGSAIDYCIDGTEGQKKISYTLLKSRATFGADGSADLPGDILKRYRQVILHERSVDPFNEPHTDRLLSEVRASEFILIGANAEKAVMAMALGLLQRGKKVTIVTDAVGSSNSKEADMAFRKMEAKGAKLTESKKIAGASHLKTVGICNCKLCRGNSPKAFLRLGTRN